jgi:MinD-like ATPase involved in chromosome partitioning or flagellar assembly
MGVPFLGRVPLDPRIMASGDSGKPFVDLFPETPAAMAFLEIVEKCDIFLKGEGR